MDILRIEPERVSLAINGDESRVITFCPTDAAFAESFFWLAEAFRDKQRELEERKSRKGGKAELEEEFALLREAYAFFRSEIDRVFGPGAAQAAFGDHNSLGAYIQFFKGVSPYIAKARRKEIDKYLHPEAAGAVMEG